MLLKNSSFPVLSRILSLGFLFVVPSKIPLIILLSWWKVRSTMRPGRITTFLAVLGDVAGGNDIIALGYQNSWTID
jgi:hypothetical protein